jgi:hypothetical protein
MDAYNEAFAAIKEDVERLQQIKEALSGIAQNPVLFTIPQDRVPTKAIETAGMPAEQWQVRSSLQKLPCSEVLLCERRMNGEKEFGIIQQFRNESPYAQANGSARVVLTGNDAARLVEDWIDNTAHTLEFMASNLVAKAHKIVWNRFASSNPSRVVRAISARCLEAASLSQGEAQTQSPQQTETIGIRV